MSELSNKSWQKIFDDYRLNEHPFEQKPAVITAKQIKTACQDFKETGAKEVRILCKQDSRENRPTVFQEKGLFLLPIKNGIYTIIQGEGYMDIPPPGSRTEIYSNRLGFDLDTSKIGNSEMQHLDFAYAVSVIRSFMDDPKLTLTIRGRKYTPPFSFRVGKHHITTKGVQTEVDAGYESDKQVVLVEAKNAASDNTIIRQLYYPFRQWQQHTDKPVHTLFFEKRGEAYNLWLFKFTDEQDYNSVTLQKSASYRISTNNNS